MANAPPFTNSGGLNGGALQRMQKLAQQLYDSTPGLHEGKSTILSNLL